MVPRFLLVLGAAFLTLVGGVSAVGTPSRADDGPAMSIGTTHVSFRSVADQDAALSGRDARPSGHVRSAELRQVDTIELDSETMTMRRDDHTIAVLSMRDGATTVRTLTRLLGTPVRTQTAEGDGGRCLPASTTSTWGGALRIAALARPSDLGNSLEVRVLRRDVATRTGAIVALTGPDGVRVGDDVAGLIRTTPADHRDFLGSTSDPAWQLLLAEGWRSQRVGAGANGVSALTDDDTVTVIGAPMPVHATARC